MTQYTCPVCGLEAEFDSAMPADYACPRCKCPGERFDRVGGEPEAGEGDAAGAGAGGLEGAPADVVADLRADFDAECREVGMYLAMARVAEREGYAEVCEYWHRAARDEAGHAARLAELLGDVVAGSTKANLEARVEAEKGAVAGKADLARRAKEADLDAVHDAVHEMARDEERHGKAFEGLLKRYFG